MEENPSSIEFGSPPNTGRRRKVIYVAEKDVLSMLSMDLMFNQHIRIPEPLGLPETAKAIGVWSDWHRNAFGIVVEDPSFDVVPEGDRLPEIEVRWRYVEVDVKSKNLP